MRNVLRLLCWSHSSILLLPVLRVLNTYSHADEFESDRYVFLLIHASYPGSLLSHLIVFSTLSFYFTLYDHIL